MNENKYRGNRGITLVAVIVTIIILVILVAVSIKVIYDMNFIGVAIEGTEGYMNAQMNELDTMVSLASYLEDVTKSITEGNENEGDSSENPVVTYTWTQDKTSVTNGEITLEVGSTVSGYIGNEVGDGNWYVLGVEDGKLLITTNSNQGTITLQGQDGYVNGVSTLNTLAAAYRDGNMAELARSINVEDINRVTGYDPDVANYRSGSNVDQWKNEVTYVKNSNGRIYYRGSKYPTSSTSSSYTTFTYWTESTWKTLASGESATITHSYYYYYPQTLSTTSSTVTQINGSAKAYMLLFDNTSDSSTEYWLGSQLDEAGAGCCQFGMRSVGSGRVRGRDLYCSNGSTKSYSHGLRPVVTIKSNIKVSSDGALSI